MLPLAVGFVMRRKSLTLLIVAMIGIVSGCAGRPPIRYEWPDTLYRFDDPRCTPDQRQAIRAATRAVIGTDVTSASVAKRLHFSCTESADGWSLTVWDVGPDEVPAPGGFTGVTLNRDFSVRSVVGGA